MNVLLALDVLGSALLAGRPGETLSGRAGSAYLQGKWRGRVTVPIIDFIMRRKGHCVGAVRGDILRAQAVIADQSRGVPPTLPPAPAP